MPHDLPSSGSVYAIEVRDHIMIAHSFKGELFGPAQALHGTTFVVDVTFMSETLAPEGVVVDIARAAETLKAILAPLNYKNLDDLPMFAGRNTTTEVMARFIFDAMAAAARAGQLGAGSATLTRLRVSLGESHTARGWFEGPIRA